VSQRLAVFASHGGSILQALLDAARLGSLPMEIVLVISNNSNSAALARAAEYGVPTAHFSSQTHPNEQMLDAAIAQALADADADWVLLAGYMKKLGETTLSRYRNRIINAHPALLPKYGGKGFFGRKVHAAVIAAGETESGATVHLVEGDYDTGPILSQVRVPVKPSDSVDDLENRVKAAERNLVLATLTELVNCKHAAGY